MIDPLTGQRERQPGETTDEYNARITRLLKVMEETRMARVHLLAILKKLGLNSARNLFVDYTGIFIEGHWTQDVRF